MSYRYLGTPGWPHIRLVVGEECDDWKGIVGFFFAILVELI